MSEPAPRPSIPGPTPTIPSPHPPGEPGEGRSADPAVALEAGKTRPTGRWRLWLALALGLVGAGAILFLPLRTWLEALLARAQALGDAGCFLFAALFIPFCVFLLPGTTVTLFCGYAYGFWPTFPAVVLASNLGAELAFVLGRTLLRERVHGWIAPRPRVRAVERAIGAESFRLVFLLRLSPLIPFNALNYVLGVTPVRFSRYALATFLGMLPGTALNCYTAATLRELGDALSGKQPSGSLAWILLALRLAATVLVIWLVARGARIALRESFATEPRAK